MEFGIACRSGIFLTGIRLAKPSQAKHKQHQEVSMIVLSSYLLCNGERQQAHVRLSERQMDNVHALFLDGISTKPLDAECGAVIDLQIPDCVRWMADYRHSEYWCSPAFGTDLSGIPDETQGLIYEKKDGSFGVILPVVSAQYKCVLCGSGSHTLTARLFSWQEGMTACHALSVVWAEGEDPYSLLEDCTKAGLALLGTDCRTRHQRQYPELFEYLGWCSWDAFEIRVDEQSVLAKCQEFRDKGIPVRWVILDDMWAEIRDFYGAQYKNRPEMFSLMHSSRLYSFKADPLRFPEGLKSCIQKINSYGLHVGMWHPTTGYWKGLDPDGEAFRQLEPCLICAGDDGIYIHSPDRQKAYQYYGVIHDYLKSCGAEFVKIDNQSMSRRYYKNQGPVGQVARQFHDAMEASVGRYFDHQMINCMGMASEDMWNRSTSPVSRCSDDFLPEDKAWFTKHILQCSYNCLIQGQFYYCDWDMWWTDDGQAIKNSILRAISGGPVYVSDPLGRSQPEVLEPLILRDGRILRCDRPAMPTRDCLTVNPVSSGKAFMLQNMCNGCGILAAFNLHADHCPVDGAISPQKVEGITGDEFALYEHFSGACTILKAHESLPIALADQDDFRLYIVVPLKNGCGMIGRTDKFISPATFRRLENGSVQLLEAGPYACVENKRLRLI